MSWPVRIWPGSMQKVVARDMRTCLFLGGFGLVDVDEDGLGEGEEGEEGGLLVGDCGDVLGEGCDPFCCLDVDLGMVD